MCVLNQTLCIIFYSKHCICNVSSFWNTSCGFTSLCSNNSFDHSHPNCCFRYYSNCHWWASVYLHVCLFYRFHFKPIMICMPIVVYYIIIFITNVILLLCILTLLDTPHTIHIYYTRDIHKVLRYSPLGYPRTAASCFNKITILFFADKINSIVITETFDYLYNLCLLQLLLHMLAVWTRMVPWSWPQCLTETRRRSCHYITHIIIEPC